MELEQVIKDINKKIKVGKIDFGVKYEKLERIPFSSCRLNYTTYGGVPVGRITELAGSESAGKTTLCLDLVGQAQKKYKDKKVLFVDIERTFDSEWATKLGVDIEKLIYFDTDSSSAEEVFNTIIELAKTGEISLIVLDSLGQMVSLQANEKQIGEKTYGGISMALTEFSKKITPILARTKTALIGINQVREDMNSMYGRTITTGGRAWRHSCSMRLECRQGNFIDEKGNALSKMCENPVGQEITVRMVKSKVCKADRRIGKCTLNYLAGIDYIGDLVDTATKYGIIDKKGAWFNLVDTETGEITNKFQGKAQICEFLAENEKELQKIQKQIEQTQEKE